MAEGDDALTATRLDVAEMKGMLKQALSDHAQRIGSAEAELRLVHARLSDKGKAIGVHDERLDGLDADVAEIKSDSSARSSRILALSGLVVAAISAALAIINRLTL